MLVSSIGYFNNRNSVEVNRSVNIPVVKTNLHAGFGHVENETPITQGNLFSRLGESLKELFSHEKSDKKEETLSVIA